MHRAKTVGIFAHIWAKCMKVKVLQLLIASAPTRRCCSYSSVPQVFYGSALFEYQTV
jgi:hypothetical protein